MRTFTRSQAQQLGGNFADEIIRRLFRTKSTLSPDDVTAVIVAAELRKQNVPLPHACRVASILAGGTDNISMTFDQLYRVAPPIGSGKFTRALSLPPAGDEQTVVQLSLSEIRSRIGGAE